MAEHILFLTGKLAEKQLNQILESIQPADFSYTVHQLGLSVAALMTADMIHRRLDQPIEADRVIVPGRCLGDLDALSAHYGIDFVRGPNELKDLPVFFGRSSKAHDLSRYDLNIFAEITDAPLLKPEQVLQRALYYHSEGADVIDIGCLPNTPFPHMEECIRLLKDEGFSVSIDSLEQDDLLRGGRAGADFLLSLDENSLWIAREVDSVPVLIPSAHGNLDTLDAAAEEMEAANRPYLLDPILDPIHFGFTESVVRYRDVRKRFADAEILMGVGNLTELTHADTAGMNALTLGICSELGIRNILVTQVSEHTRTAIREADRGRRIMYAAHVSDSLPKHIDDGLMALHECAAFPYSEEEIREFAASIRDPSFRIQNSTRGVHIYNRDGLHTATDPFDLFPQLALGDDTGHAFYLGVQTARAQIAWQLGKRFDQDEPLRWGCAVEFDQQTGEYKKPGSTMKSGSQTPPEADAETR